MSEPNSIIEVAVRETVELRKFDGEIEEGKEPTEIIQVSDTVRTVKMTAAEAARLRE